MKKRGEYGGEANGAARATGGRVVVDWRVGPGTTERVSWKFFGVNVSSEDGDGKSGCEIVGRGFAGYNRTSCAGILRRPI